MSNQEVKNNQGILEINIPNIETIGKGSFRYKNKELNLLCMTQYQHYVFCIAYNIKTKELVKIELSNS